jgi:hypothetical protein
MSARTTVEAINATHKAAAVVLAISIPPDPR